MTSQDKTMTNQDKVTEVIRTWQKRHPNLMDSNTSWAAQNLAGDLAKAGLLAPNLPKPDHDRRDPEWRSEYEENYDHPAPDVWCKDPWLSVGVFPEEQDVTIWDDGEPMEPFSIAEARKFAYALLAAAECAEKNSHPC